MVEQAEIVICGAGITGVSAAYFLAKTGVKDILLVDERPPLSFTSDRSAECYRNWWGDAAMLGLANRSIDILEELAEESRNVFQMNRRGYLFVTGDESRLTLLQAQSEKISGMGWGEFRTHTTVQSAYQPASAEGYRDAPGGVDLLMGSQLVQKHFPSLSNEAIAALHVRRAGWLSAQQLGMLLLEKARGLGVRFLSDRVTGVEVQAGRVDGVQLRDSGRIQAPVFVNAAGPFATEVGSMLGLDLPIHTELHLKAVIADRQGVVDRDAPLLIWNDPQTLPWKEEEKHILLEDPESAWLCQPFPQNVHTRPEGGADSQNIILLWEYQEKITPPVWPPPLDDQFPEIALRGLARLLPEMQVYFERIPRPQLDGGYYTKTRENRPLACPLPVEGSFMVGAVSGYGIMSACGFGELLAAHITGSDLPPYAPAFDLERYQDEEYLKEIASWQDNGQL